MKKKKKKMKKIFPKKIKFNLFKSNTNFLFSSYCTQKRRNLDEITPTSFWETNQRIARKRAENEDKLFFVFIDGPTGAGKNNIIWRLNKNGYQTFSNPFDTFYLVKISN